MVELGNERLVDEIEGGIMRRLVGETTDVEWELGDGSTRGADVTLKELYEKVLPPLDDELARAASEFDTLEELRGDIEGKIREQLEERSRASSARPPSTSSSRRRRSSRPGSWSRCGHASC